MELIAKTPVPVDASLLLFCLYSTSDVTPQGCRQHTTAPQEIMKKRDTKESVLLKLDELSRSQHNGKRDSGTQQRPASLNGPIGMIPMFRRRSRWSLR